MKFALALVAIGVVFTAAPVLAQPAPSVPSAAQMPRLPGPYGPQVTLAQARAIVDAAHREARTRNLRMAFTVVQPSGEPILLEVMDGTQYASIEVAQKKARTAARFRRSTKAFADAVAAGNLGILSVQEAIAVEGGVPLVAKGLVIGGLGVSGGTAVEDGQVAAAALANVKLD